MPPVQARAAMCSPGTVSLSNVQWRIDGADLVAAGTIANECRQGASVTIIVTTRDKAGRVLAVYPHFVSAVPNIPPETLTPFETRDRAVPGIAAVDIGIGDVTH